MRDNSFISVTVLIVLCVMIFGGHLGIAVTGGLEKPTVSSEAPGILQVIGWCWDGLSFFFELLTFQIQDVPIWISGGLWMFISIMLVWILAKWVRGTQGA